jgi:hypothetical protein
MSKKNAKSKSTDIKIGIKDVERLLLYCKHVAAFCKMEDPPVKPPEGIAMMIDCFKEMGEDFSDKALEESLKVFL